MTPTFVGLPFRSPKNQDAIVDTDRMDPFFCSRVDALGLMRLGGGVIINLASATWLGALPDRPGRFFTKGMLSAPHIETLARRSHG